MIVDTLNFSPLMTAQAVADHLSVSLDTVYQSIPGRPYRCKLAKPLPTPLRLGSRNLLRWRKDQIDQYIQSLIVPEEAAAVVTPKNLELSKPLVRRGRPPKRSAFKTAGGGVA